MSFSITTVSATPIISLLSDQAEREAKNPRLSVHLVSWNGEKYIPYLFASLRAQTFRDWQLYIWDNCSSDLTVAEIRREAASLPVRHTLHVNDKNIGFAGGHNQLFGRTDSEYFLLLNQDMYLSLDCLEKLVFFLDSHPEAAAATPRLMRWNFGALAAEVDHDQPADQVGRSFESDELKKSFTNYVDSLGLKVWRSRQVVEWLTGQEWGSERVKASIKSLTARSATSTPEPVTAVPVFGVSGAFPMYRRSAIQAVASQTGEFFDSSYHSYKEDVDLAWRLAAAGWQSFVLPDTIAYHDRSAASPSQLTDRAASENKKTQSQWVKYHSYKNHLMTLYKNEYWQNFALDLPWILWYELKKFIWFMFFDRKVLMGLREVWRNREKLRIKRAEIRERRVASWKMIRRWWN